jgi:DNA-binding protein HU-beta
MSSKHDLVPITEALVKGDAVSFIGFGTFSTASRAARTAKVPGTDRTVNVAATTVAKFKVGKALKDAVAK